VPTRRTILLGGAGAAAALVGIGVGVEKDVLPGRTFAYTHLGLNGEDGVIPDVEPGPVLEDSFTSAARGGIDVGWSLILPPGTDASTRLPVVVALHWLGADHATLTGPSLGLDRFLAQYVEDDGVPFAIAAPDGGRGYWHPHDGDDGGAMVTEELLPQLDGRGYDTRRVAYLGWSMGGYGALRLAGLRGPDATAGVVAASPALWRDADEASRDGFDDADEYRTYSIVDDQQQLAGIPVRIDIGKGDPFWFEVEDYARGLYDESDQVHTDEPGGHTPGYWRRILPAQLQFLGGVI